MTCKTNRNQAIDNLLRNPDILTKVRIYFSSQSPGDDYDPYENNTVYSNLNPVVIKAYVREVSPEALVYKQYGLHQMGAKEILCDDKYKSWFENCNKIEIEDVEYQVFKEGTGGRTLISKRQYGIIRVVVTRNG